VSHRVVSDDGSSFDTGDIAANSTASKSLAKGSYPYHCAYHVAMKG
jgi:plastocyanin